MGAFTSCRLTFTSSRANVTPSSSDQSWNVFPCSCHGFAGLFCVLACQRMRVFPDGSLTSMTLGFEKSTPPTARRFVRLPTGREIGPHVRPGSRRKRRSAFVQANVARVVHSPMSVDLRST